MYHNNYIHEMLSKNKVKFIISLQKKKTRDEENLFVIEGDKLVKEFLSAKKNVRLLAAKPEFLNSIPAELLSLAEEIETISYEELKHISTLKTPHNALAVVEKPEPVSDYDEILDQLSVLLDCVQDPGNLGTIIRAAAWFGIKTIVCSNDSVDVYNPKVIQASMGAFMHVNVCYNDLKEFLGETLKRNLPVFGTVLNGESIYDHKLDYKGVILLGNESKGISEELVPYITDKIIIPGPGESRPGIESLNVSMAASIVFSEFYRRSK
jgi:RNA methyltransferase, TrmH family